jgi:hypothetical protein
LEFCDAIAEEWTAEMRASNAAKGALIGLFAAVPSLAAFRGFTVDDALVSARVAEHLAAGHGYRFNATGPMVDAVTPLGWANLLAAFGPASVLGMLERGRVLGTVAWLVAAAALGALGGAGRRERAVLAGALLLSAPLGVWAGAGMETGLVTLFATLALLEVRLASLAAGAAAAWRPELLAWAWVLAAGSALLVGTSARERSRELLLRVALALGPALAVACVRKTVFGSWAPLAVWAKPSDLAHGVFYAVGAFLGTGVPLFCVAPRAIGRADGRTRLLLLALASHFVALVLAGGDWMVLYRLAVPVLPTAILAAARLARFSTPRALTLRGIVAAAVSLWFVLGVAWQGRRVLEHRLALIDAARPVFGGARSIACLDVGWVGAATEASLVDLAGITDPVIAHLAGGHTSKHIPNGLLENRAVDTAVLLLAPGRAPAPRWQDSVFNRNVETRLAEQPAFERFRLRGVLPLGGTEQVYIVVTP